MTVHNLASNKPSADEIDHKQEGRHYHDNKDAAYLLPDDDFENDRMHMQHFAIKGVFGGNFNAPVEQQLQQGISVLDSGCGPGTWTIDMAKTYKESKFYGIDLSSGFPTETKPANTEFKVHNITEPLPFPDDFFGFIHQRLVFFGLRTGEWKPVIANLLRTLKPGAWLELTECTSPDMVNRGPKMTILMEAVGAMAKLKDVHTRVSFDLESYMNEAGVNNVTVIPMVTPLNQGDKISDLLWESFYLMYASVHTIVAKANPELELESEEAYKKFLKEAGEECKQNKTGLIWRRVYGQKPEKS